MRCKDCAIDYTLYKASETPSSNTAFEQNNGRSRDVPEYSCTGGISSSPVSGVPLLQVSGTLCKKRAAIWL